MKKTFAIILALAAVCGSMLTSCTKDEGDIRNLIQGNWVLVRTVVTETTDGVEGPSHESFNILTTYYTFGEKNQWERGYVDIPNSTPIKGSYKLRGNKLVITIPPVNSHGENERLIMTIDDLSETTLVLSQDETSSPVLSEELTFPLGDETTVPSGDEKSGSCRVTRTFKRGDIELGERERMLEGGWQVVDGSVRVVNYGEVSILPLLGEGESCLFEFDTRGMWKGVINCAALASLWHGDISDGPITPTGFYTVEGNRLALDNILSSYSGDHENPPCFIIEQIEENDLQLSIDLDSITTGETPRATRITVKLKKNLGSIN